MTTQYLRQASLIVGKNNGDALDLSQLRFSFEIRRGDLQTPNTADVRVYNVAQATADAIMQIKPAPEFTRVVIQAGYEGNFGVIFDGSIKQTRIGRENQTDTYLDIMGADGDEAYNFSMSIFSIPAGSVPNNEISGIIENMAKYGISSGYIPNLGGNPLPRGKVVYGMSRDELRNIARNTSTSWSIQDGKVNLIPLTAYKPAEIPVITSETGMIGLPTQTQNGIEIRALLNPQLKVGQLVKLDNASIQRLRYGTSVLSEPTNDFLQSSIKTNADGYYYIMRVDHIGDTRGEPWWSDMTCLAVDATNVRIEQTPTPALPPSIKRYG